jgi:hypothetical protein
MENSMNLFPGGKPQLPEEAELADTEIVPQPKNQYEKFIGFHDYKSGPFRMLDFILKRQGAEELLKEIQKNPLPDFKTYFLSTKEKPELNMRITQDLALNSHETTNLIGEFDQLIANMNRSSSPEEAETRYKALVGFFAKYSNSLEDNLS